MTPFHERKRLKAPGLEISLGFTVIVMGVVTLEDGKLTTGEMWLLGLLVCYAVGIVILFRNLVLDLTVDASGVRFRYPPFIRKERVLPWGQIADFHVVRYKPVSQYLGWGYRRNRRLGKAYTTDGDLGLYLSLSDGSNVLLSVREADKLIRSLRSNPQLEAVYRDTGVILLS